MPVTTLEGRHSNAVGEGCLTSPTAWAQRWASSRQCESVELTEARSQAPAFLPESSATTTALEPQPADIGWPDMTTGNRVRQLFSPSLRYTIRHGNGAWPL